MSTLRGLLRSVQNVLQNDRLPQVQRVGVVRSGTGLGQLLPGHPLLHTSVQRRGRWSFSGSQLRLDSRAT